MKIAVMIDSAADISKEEAERENIIVTRFAINIDGKDYIDEEDLTLDSFKQFLEEQRDIHTSQTPLGSLIKQWQELLEEYDHIIYLTLSDKLSGAYQSAVAASGEFEDKITVVNTHGVAYPIQMIYKEVLQLIEIGLKPQEIKEKVEDFEPLYAYIIPNDLNYLKKGGRISPQAATLANLLKIIPILVLKDGVIDAYAKVRTNKRAIDKAINDISDKFIKAQDYYWFILHSDLDDKVAEYKDQLEDLIDEEVMVAELHPIILAHTGPKTFAVAALKKMI